MVGFSCCGIDQVRSAYCVFIVVRGNLFGAIIQGRIFSGLIKYSILITLETFTAPAAFLSLYFLLHAQKKVPKKRAATVPKRNASGRPHSRHARKPKSPMLAEINFRGLGRPQHPPPTSCSAAALPLHQQPHISSFHLRCFRLAMRLTESWPFLKTS